MATKFLTVTHSNFTYLVSTYIEPHVAWTINSSYSAKNASQLHWRFKTLTNRCSAIRCRGLNVKDKNVIKALARHCQSIYRWRRGPAQQQGTTLRFRFASFSRRQDFPASPVPLPTSNAQYPTSNIQLPSRQTQPTAMSRLQLLCLSLPKLGLIDNYLPSGSSSFRNPFEPRYRQAIYIHICCTNLYIHMLYISHAPPIWAPQLLVSGAAERQVKVVVDASLQLSNGIIKFIPASITFRLYIN